MSFIDNEKANFVNKACVVYVKSSNVQAQQNKIKLGFSPFQSKYINTMRKSLLIKNHSVLDEDFIKTLMKEK